MRVWNLDALNGWGHRMDWTDYEKRTINGHLSMPRVEVGDVVYCEMKTNQTNGIRQWREFVVEELEYMINPDDQFFGKVRDIAIVTVCPNGMEIKIREGKQCPFCEKMIKNFQKGTKHFHKKHEKEFIEVTKWE